MTKYGIHYRFESYDKEYLHWFAFGNQPYVIKQQEKLSNEGNELEDEVGGSVRASPTIRQVTATLGAGVANATAATPIDSRSEMVSIQRPTTIKVDPEPQQGLSKDYNFIFFSFYSR